jgi:hypothetical protein
MMQGHVCGDHGGVRARGNGLAPDPVQPSVEPTKQEWDAFHAEGGGSYNDLAAFIRSYRSMAGVS